MSGYHHESEPQVSEGAACLAMAYPVDSDHANADESTSLLAAAIRPPLSPPSSSAVSCAAPAPASATATAATPTVSAPRKNHSYQKAFSIDVDVDAFAENPYLEDMSDLANRTRRRKTLLTHLSYAFLILIVTIYAVGMSRGHTSRHAPHVHHDHTIPTLLGVRHHDDGRFVNALGSSLYEGMKSATYHHKKRGVLHEFDVYGKSLRSGANAKEEAPPKTDNDRSLPRLSVNTNSVSFHESLVVSWKDGHKNHGQQIRGSDVVALYCPADESDPTKFRDAAKIKEARRTTRHVLNDAARNNGDETEVDVHIPDDEWHISSFPIIRESTCEFRLWLRDDARARETGDGRGTEHHYVLAATTGPFEIRHGMTTPTGLHLALTNDASEMVASFTTGHAGTPVVEYGTNKNDLKHVARGTSTTYAATDMCQAPANVTEPGKFVDPGWMHAVTMSKLKLDTDYHYRVGIERPADRHNDGKDKRVHWSEVYKFRSSPELLAPGSGSDQAHATEKGGEQQHHHEPYTYVVYADQGAPGYGAKDGSKLVTSWAQHEVHQNNIRAVHHFGDLSYANGAGHMWDAWMDMVSTAFATHVPLMVGVGNHEYDHTDGGDSGRDPSGVADSHGFQPSWGNFHADSNGECGVPTSKRFQMPPNGNGVFWYSYDAGLVHTIMISSEHDLSSGSEQYAWLESDLMGVDRSVTPFVIVESHRPLYNSEDVPANTIVSLAMRDEIEDLLVDHGVDMFLAGHYHAYLRTCAGLYQSKCDNGGPVHITVGSAGAELDRYPLYEQDWTEYFGREWGYGRISVLSRKELKFEFVAEEGGELVVRDEVWIRK